MNDMALSDLFRDAGGDTIDDVDTRFDEVVRQASPDELGAGVAEALRSDQTPPLGEMVSQLFDRSSSTQQAGLLNQILSTLGPAIAGALGGGALGPVLRPGQTEVTPEQATQVSPRGISEIVANAEKQRPEVVDQLGRFYAQHASLIKTLGGTALLIALAKMRHNAR